MATAAQLLAEQKFQYQQQQDAAKSQAAAEAAAAKEERENARFQMEQQRFALQAQNEGQAARWKREQEDPYGVMAERLSGLRGQMLNSNPWYQTGAAIRDPRLMPQGGKWYEQLAGHLLQGAAGGALQGIGLGQVNPEYEAASSAFLANPNDPSTQTNPYTQQWATQNAFREMGRQKQERADLTKSLAGQGLMVGGDGSVALRPGYAEAMGELETTKRRAQNPIMSGLLGGKTGGVLGSAQRTGPAPLDIPDDVQEMVDAGFITSDADLGKAITDSRKSAQTLTQQQNTDIDALRNEIMKRPSAVMLQQSIPALHSMQAAMNNTDRASDLDYIYGLAKILDPNSVVRESEGQLIYNGSDSLLGKLIGQANANLTGRAAIDPEARRSIYDEASRRVDGYRSLFEQDAAQVREVATRRGYDPALIIPQLKGPSAPATPSNQDPAAAGAQRSLPAPALQQLDDNTLMQLLQQRQGGAR